MQNKHCLSARGLSKAINNKKKKLHRVKKQEQQFIKTKTAQSSFARLGRDNVSFICLYFYEP